MKIKFIMVFTAMMVLMYSLVSYAGQWQTSPSGWWYDNGDGSWPTNGWKWIDGNDDGVSECYYFDMQGYCLMDAFTPDGYYVNKGGAWEENGIVKTIISDTCIEELIEAYAKKRYGEEKSFWVKHVGSNFFEIYRMEVRVTCGEPDGYDTIYLETVEAERMEGEIKTVDSKKIVWLGIEHTMKLLKAKGYHPVKCIITEDRHYLFYVDDLNISLIEVDPYSCEGYTYKFEFDWKMYNWTDEFSLY